MSRILLIEDNRSYAATLRSNLEREGYAVEVAATGAEGLELARTGKPDLVILDLMLPGLNGFTVLQRLRDEGYNTPLLIMTALGAEQENCGASDSARTTTSSSHAGCSRSSRGCELCSSAPLLARGRPVQKLASGT